MNNGLPMDFAGQQSEIQQRQALAQALMQSGLMGGAPQGQMVSGHYVSPGVLGALLPGMKMLAGQAMGNRAGADAQKLSGDYNQALAQGLQSYMDTRAQDPRKAMIQAMTSGFAPLQDVGKMELAATIKGENGETFSNPVTERGPDGSLISVQYGNKGTRRPVQGAVPFEKPMSVADRVVDPANPTKPLADYSTKGGETKTVNGDLYQVDSQGKWHKLDNAPKVNVNAPTSVMVAGQKAGMGKWAELAGGTVNELSETARSSVKLLNTLNQLEASGKAGVFSGPTANAAQFVSGLAESLGVSVDKAKLANSQTFDAASISAWQDMIKAAGGNRGVVKEEAARIAQMVPQLVQSPQGRQQITAYLRQVASQNIKDAQTAQKEYGQALRTENPELFTFGLSNTQIPNTTPNPAAAGSTSPAGGQPMGIDEYIKMKRGR